MRTIKIPKDKMSEYFTIEDADQSINDIVEREGAVKLLEFAKETTVSSEAKKVREELLNNINVAHAWSGKHRLPKYIEYIFTRCVVLDGLANNDEMQGRYCRIAPFLVALGLYADFPVVECLTGELRISEIHIH